MTQLGKFAVRFRQSGLTFFLRNVWGLCHSCLLSMAFWFDTGARTSVKLVAFATDTSVVQLCRKMRCAHPECCKSTSAGKATTSHAHVECHCKVSWHVVLGHQHCQCWLPQTHLLCGCAAQRPVPM